MAGAVVEEDEKTGIQALQRAAEDKPMKPGLPQRLEYEYIRHGTQALIASFEVATGELVKGSVVDQRTESEFAAHIVEVMSADPLRPGGYSLSTSLTPTSQNH